MKTFWKKKLPACLLALALLAGTVPMASAASADLTYDVDEDSGVWLDADDFQEIYEDDNGGYLEYVEFTDYDDFDDYGYFTFEDFDRYGFDDVDSKALENYEFYYDRADADDYDIDLDTLRFETYDNIDSDTLDFDVRLYGDEGSFYATVRIDVEGGSRSGSGDVELTYKVDPGDDVIVADPSYPCNRELVRSFEGRVIDVPTSAATRFHLTADLCSQYWTSKTKAVMITSPSNPTGTTIDFNVLDEVCKLAASRGAWRIVDETYLDLADREPDGTEVKSVLACDPDAIVCNSFSKFFGMTGWRLGWAILPDDPTVLEAVDDLATNYYLCAHTPTQHAALACFTPESLAECEARRQELLARRRIVIDGLKRIGLPVEVEPNGAFYAYFDISRTGLDAWTFCERALDEAHVALTPGRDFGAATADTHVRLSYAASREALTEGLERLGTFVESL